MSAHRRTQAVHWAGLVAPLLAFAVTVRYALVTWQRRAPEDVSYPYTLNVMTDFRDTAVLPARAIAAGMNPYDIVAYKEVFPFAQEFNPYAPWWLGVTAPFGRMSWSDATLIFSCFLAVTTSLFAFAAGWLAHRQLRQIGLPGWVSAPTFACAVVVFTWLWRPTTIGQGLGNVGAFAALACLLALMVRNAAWGSLLVALAWVKPQFAIPLVLLLLLRREWLKVLSGTGAAILASLPMVLKLSAIAGGFPELVGSVFDAVAILGQRTGGEPLTGRIDLSLWSTLVGIGSDIPATALGVGLLVLSARFSVFLERRGRPAAGVTMMALALLLAFPHLHYDLAMLAPAVAWMGLEAALRPRGLRLGHYDLTLLTALVMLLLAGLPWQRFLGGLGYNRALAGMALVSLISLSVWSWHVCEEVVTSGDTDARHNLRRLG